MSIGSTIAKAASSVITNETVLNSFATTLKTFTDNTSVYISDPSTDATADYYAPLYYIGAGLTLFVSAITMCQVYMTWNEAKATALPANNQPVDDTANNNIELGMITDRHTQRMV